ncbi:hypothetical protein H5410_016202 [Solanum commersonii]|uniref:Uncharacterized protein n=1 Tax=Solanum commersonii TaxID=4109 RepID=A0A9J5ZWP7_SOLCO|nr:hypothetical protein H5410_016202 [Solanum commersonii]
MRVPFDSRDDFRPRYRVKETSDSCFDDFIEFETLSIIDFHILYGFESDSEGEDSTLGVTVD